MSDTPTTEDNSKEQIDMFWVVANIFAIIYIIEDKFGPATIEQLVKVASEIEKSMKEENEQQ
jgi:hypothetical protein